MNAIKIYRDACHKADNNEITFDEYVNMILPLEDVEVVVRCKDCRHRLSVYCFLNDKFGVIVNDNDFCSRGERKANDKV